MAGEHPGGHSVKAQLNRARRAAAGYQDMQRLMDRYAIERFLYRLGRSRYAERLILKGAMLLAVYLPDAYRSTRDADFLGFGTFTLAGIKRMLAEICADEQDDGLAFGVSAITVEPAGADREYPGYAVVVPARLEDTACDIKIDIGIGEAVVPPAQKLAYPTILPMPRPNIRVVPLVVVVAEKFEALTALGMSNSRMKDFYDLSQIARRCVIDGQELCEAMRATFDRRKTPLPTATPIALTAAFYDSKRKKSDWDTFLRRHSLPRRPELAAACKDIEGFLMPVAQALVTVEPFAGSWREERWASI
jgi:predicted nucleotidyltransferase component of viral defense system